MEFVRCNLCGNDNYRPIMELSDDRFRITDELFRIVQCTQCGLMYTNPRPAEEEMGRFYPSEYYDHRKDITSPSAASDASKSGTLGAFYEKLKRMKRQLRLLEKARRIEQMRGRGKLLDVGCASGDFLAFMKQRGWDSQGVEVSPQMCEYARTHYGLKVFNGHFQEAGFEAGSFDIITFWSVLEHLHDPLATLREAARMLKPGGKVIVLVPNIESWEAKLLGDKWPHLDIPRHLFHFSPRTLTGLLHKADLHVIKICHFTTLTANHLNLILYARLSKRMRSKPQVTNYASIYLIYRALNIVITPLSWLASWAKRGHTIIAYASKEG